MAAPVVAPGSGEEMEICGAFVFTTTSTVAMPTRPTPSRPRAVMTFMPFVSETFGTLKAPFSVKRITRGGLERPQR